MKQRKIPLEEFPTIIKKYQDGLSTTAIGKMYDVAPNSIGAILKKHDIKLRNSKRKGKKLNGKNRKIPLSEIPNIVQKYNDGMSSVKLSEEYGITSTNIIRLLNQEGIVLRSNKENSRRFNCDHFAFYKIDTQEKAYWLGFMYADGYIVSNSPAIGLSLGIEDHEHVKKFKEFLKADYPIKEYIGTGYSNKTKYARLLVTSEQLKLDLIDKGCVEQKTKVIKPPSIDTHLIPHFIRGYMDGDGCITRYKSKGYYIVAVKIVGTDELLNWMNNWISLNCNFKIPSLYKRRATDIVSSLEMHGNKRSKLFLDLIYKDATIYLDRKYEKYNNWLC